MKWSPGYPLDLISPARHAATQMEGAEGRPLSIQVLAQTYNHFTSADINRVRRAENLDEFDAKCFVLQKAIEELGEGVVQDDDGYRLADAFEDLRFDGRPVHRVVEEKHWVDAFNPLLEKPAGVRGQPFYVNIRQSDAQDDITELKKSLDAFGWIEEFPALADENGVVLVGHRRLRAAQELGIEPIIKVLPLGNGEDAASKRWKLAWASNIASKPMSKADMARVGEYLYGEGWTLKAIGEMLNVHTATVARWSEEFSQDAKTQHDKVRAETGQKSKGGRPRNGTPSPRRQSPKITPEIKEAIITKAFDEGIADVQIAKELGLGETVVHKQVAIEAALREDREQRTVQPESPPALESLFDEPPLGCEHEWVCKKCGQVHEEKQNA